MLKNYCKALLHLNINMVITNVCDVSDAIWMLPESIMLVHLPVCCCLLQLVFRKHYLSLLTFVIAYSVQMNFLPFPVNKRNLLACLHVVIPMLKL